MSRTSSTFSFTRTIAAKREDLARARKEVADLAALSADFAPAYAIANAIAKFADTQGFNKYVYATPSAYTSWDGQSNNRLDVSFDGKVDSLKEGPVPALCEFILGFGLEAKDTTDYTNDYCASRTFKFTSNIGNVKLNVSFEAGVNEGSEACRKVLTGTEIKEVAKYEIVCA